MIEQNKASDRITSLMFPEQLLPSVSCHYEETSTWEIPADRAVRRSKHSRAGKHLPVLRVLQGHPCLQPEMRLLQRLEGENT